ncbi:hypothetical protein IPG41_07005 [Candidatus Peregrinibacteria bacterium]|nr:MAG: hypothetical protein IPG41_07005 [Candidatus Peregrinibacteria bacterium]
MSQKPIDVQAKFGRLQPNRKKKGVTVGHTLFSVVQAASRVDTTDPLNAKNAEGFTDISGRWVKFTEE